MIYWVVFTTRAIFCCWNDVFLNLRCFQIISMKFCYLKSNIPDVPLLSNVDKLIEAYKGTCL